MTARIYRPAKTAMQSGKGKSDVWILEHEPQEPKTIEPLMGYVSSRDMMAQVKLTFETREAAIAYAERNGLRYRVTEPKDSKRRNVSYAANFNHDRKVPWTH